MANRGHIFDMASAVKIASVWVVALLGGWLLRALIPPKWGVFKGEYIYRVNQIAFWLRLIAASIVTTVWVIRLCVQDLRIS
ncbi:MAG: hypothetical protein WCA20_34325 [Candidatus Sulfotelmatobacter sp.]